MIELLLFGGFAILAGVLQHSMLSAVPLPFALLHLPTLLVVMLISHFRAPIAFLAAALSGMVMDILSPAPFGTLLVASCAQAFLLRHLFLRVFTNRTWPAFIGIHIAGFFLFYTLSFCARFVASYIQDGTLFALPKAFSWGMIAIALAMQTIIGAGIMQLAVRIKRIFLSMFFFAHRT